MALKREQTRRIMVGKLAVGGGAPVSIQTMTNTKTADALATIKQIEGFAEAGCDIVRLSVPDEASLQALPEIRRAVELPLIADIHFNHKLAIGAIDEDLNVLRELEILVDGDGPHSYLLQIFLREAAGLYKDPAAGPFFFEIIQRKGDEGFGAGNFRALFESIERMQTS